MQEARLKNANGENIEKNETIFWKDTTPKRNISKKGIPNQRMSSRMPMKTNEGVYAL